MKNQDKSLLLTLSGQKSDVFADFSSILPLIPKSPYRHDICNAHLCKLIAQTRYGYGYRVFVYVLVNAPNLVYQLLFGNNLIFIEREIIQYLKLLCGKRYGFFLIFCLKSLGRYRKITVMSCSLILVGVKLVIGRSCAPTRITISLKENGLVI